MKGFNFLKYNKSITILKLLLIKINKTYHVIHPSGKWFSSSLPLISYKFCDSFWFNSKTYDKNGDYFERATWLIDRKESPKFNCVKHLRCFSQNDFNKKNHGTKVNSNNVILSDSEQDEDDNEEKDSNNLILSDSKQDDNEEKDSHEIDDDNDTVMKSRPKRDCRLFLLKNLVKLYETKMVSRISVSELKKMVKFRITSGEELIDKLSKICRGNDVGFLMTYDNKEIIYYDIKTLTRECKL